MTTQPVKKMTSADLTDFFGVTDIVEQSAKIEHPADLQPKPEAEKTSTPPHMKASFFDYFVIEAR